MIDPVYLALSLSAWKETETRAKMERARLETMLAGALNFTKPEGQESFEIEGDLGSAKVVCKQPVNVTLDQEYLSEKVTILPDPVRAILRTRYEINTKAARELQETDPESWAIASRFITRKPGKIQVSVTEYESRSI